MTSKTFQCKRCGECCRWGGYVYITEEDIAVMSGRLGMSEYDFVNTYAEIIHRPRVNLKTKEDGRCVFQEGNDCSVHDFKPRQCRDFPEVWRIKELESFCCARRESKERAAGQP